MTVLFGLKNSSHQDNVERSFTNLKEKLQEYENKKEKAK